MLTNLTELKPDNINVYQTNVVLNLLLIDPCSNNIGHIQINNLIAEPLLVYIQCSFFNDFVYTFISQAVWSKVYQV